MEFFSKVNLHIWAWVYSNFLTLCISLISAPIDRVYTKVYEIPITIVKGKKFQNYKWSFYNNEPYLSKNVGEF